VPVDQGEYREITALFCDLGGYTAWNEEEDPEHVVLVLDRIKQAAIAIIECHGGLANQFVGDEIVGLFGVVEQHEDDPARAVSAALELHHFVRNQSVFRADGERRVLEMHSGVESGTVLVRAGNQRGGIFDVVGDAINVAARLRSLAPLGDILCGPHAFPRLGPGFDAEARGPVGLRGKAQPLLAHRVLGIRRQSRPLATRSGTLTAYTGRANLLVRLQAAYRDACAGRPRLLMFEGPAGIGKSRLLHEFRAWLAPGEGLPAPRLLSGRCFAYGRTAPYQPFIDVLLDAFQLPLEDPESPARAFARIAAGTGLSAEGTEALRYLLSLQALRSGDVPQSREAMRAAIVSALSEFVFQGDRPLVLLLEDWHAADEASQYALRHVARGVSGRRALVVVNRRPAESVDVASQEAIPEAEVCALEPLDEAATIALASHALSDAELAPALARFIHERSLGNPFFVEEICRSLLDHDALAADEGLLSLRADAGSVPVPDSVQAVVRSRVSRLLSQQRRVLCVASVIGIDFSRDELTALWSQPYAGAANAADGTSDGLEFLPESGSLDAPLAELARLGLVQDLRKGSYRFQHAITQSVVYGSLSIAARRWFHERYARSLVQRFPPDQLESVYEVLSYHHGRGNDLCAAVHYAALAGDKAWRSFSLDQASAQYAAALSALDKMRPLTLEQKRQRIELTTRWARVDLYNPNRSVLDAIDASQKLAEDLGDALSACLCFNWRSWLEYALGNYAAAFAASTGFMRAARGLSDHRLEAQAHTNFGLTQAMACRYGEALASLHEGMRIRGRDDGTGNTYSQGYLGLIHADRGDFDAADLAIAEAEKLGEATGRLTIIGPMLIQRGMVELWKGELGRCVATAQRARAVGERIAGKYIRAMAEALEGYAAGIGGTASALGSTAKLKGACATLERLGIRLHVSWCYGLLAELSWIAGDAEGASQAARAALARADEHDALGEVHACLTLAKLGTTDAERAAWLARAEGRAAEKGSRRELAVIARLR
jgi:class 3 adenylate cyclase